MEDKEFRDAWEKETKEEFSPYTDKELEKMVVSAARKSIRGLYPGVILAGTVWTATAFQIWRVKENAGSPMMWFDLFIAVMLVFALAVLLYSYARMNRIEPDKTVGEWIEYRIRAVERSLRLKKKYRWIVYLSSLLIAAWPAMVDIFVSGTPLPLALRRWITILALCYVFVYLLRKWERKRYLSVYARLKELYEQFTG